MPQKYDLTNQRFYRLVALRHLGHGYWECACDCGAIFNAVVTRLRNQQSKSCGCHSRKSNRGRTKHGMHGSPEYAAWMAMKRRCLPNSVDRRYYADKGVAVCPEWQKSFQAFYASVGPRPSPKHSLDRYPDCNGNYQPDNVRWATASEQKLNARNAVLITFRGKTQNAIKWASEIGLNTSVITRRLKKGWPVERVLSSSNYSLGEARASSRLTNTQVKEIRDSSLSCKKTGAIYGVSPSTINEIRRRLTWRHIP